MPGKAALLVRIKLNSPRTQFTASMKTSTQRISPLNRSILIGLCVSTSFAYQAFSQQDQPGKTEVPKNSDSRYGTQSRAADSQTLTAETFAHKAAFCGIKEVVSSEIALEKTQNSQIRQFASRLIEDHSRANQELKRLAQTKGIQLPPTNALTRSRTGKTSDQLPVRGTEDNTTVRPGDQIPRDSTRTPGAPGSTATAGQAATGAAHHEMMKQEAQKEVEHLETLSGKEFDRAYVEGMVKDHARAVELFQKASQSLNDPALKQFATSTLPKLRSHQQEAQRLLQVAGNDASSTTTPGR